MCILITRAVISKRMLKYTRNNASFTQFDLRLEDHFMIKKPIMGEKSSLTKVSC